MCDTTLVVIQIVDIHGVAVFEPKRHPPVGGDGYRMVTLQAALERMKPKAGNVHSIGAAAAVQRGQYAQEFRDVLLRHPR